MDKTRSMKIWEIIGEITVFYYQTIISLSFSTISRFFFLILASLAETC